MSWACWGWALLVKAIALVLVTAPAALPSPDPSRAGYVDLGRASWVRASLGPDYLALPRSPRGTRVRICGKAGCVERRSTDVGPSQALFPGRVADLSMADFEYVTGEDPSVGTAMVTVEYLDHPSAP